VTKFQVIRDILALGGVTAQQKLVLIAMNQYGDDGSNIYPSLHSIAKVCGLGYRQVKRHAKTLRDKGYLVPVGKSRLNTVNYRMSIPRDMSVPKIGTVASPSMGHQRPPTPLNNIPYKNPPKQRDSYYDSDYYSPGWPGDRTTREDDAVSVQKRLAAYRLRNHGR
jgi:biotin operon repressor